MRTKVSLDPIALERATVLGTEQRWERAYETLLEGSTGYDPDLFTKFRDVGCRVAVDDIENLTLEGCVTLIIAISRQLRWDEPPVFSINGKLVDLQPDDFAFQLQIKALIERLNKLC